MKNSLYFLLIGFMLFSSCTTKKHPEGTATTKNVAETVYSSPVKDSIVAKKAVSKEEKHSKNN